jgi:hypothetical protein
MFAMPWDLADGPTALLIQLIMTDSDAAREGIEKKFSKYKSLFFYLFMLRVSSKSY